MLCAEPRFYSFSWKLLSKRLLIHLREDRLVKPVTTCKCRLIVEMHGAGKATELTRPILLLHQDCTFPEVG